METVATIPVSLTENAIQEVKRLINEEGFDTPQADDEEYAIEDITYIMNKSHGLYLFGMQVDWQGGLNSRGFTFTNPNASKTCGCGTSFAV